MTGDTGTQPLATESETEPPDGRCTILIWVIFVYLCVRKNV